jgi:hypothetical protein
VLQHLAVQFGDPRVRAQRIGFERGGAGQELAVARPQDVGEGLRQRDIVALAHFTQVAHRELAAQRAEQRDGKPDGDEACDRKVAQGLEAGLQPAVSRGARGHSTGGPRRVVHR